MVKIVTVAEMRAIEQASVDHGVSLDQLQLNAATAIAEHVAWHPGPHLFLAGPGNNGRDALIAAAIHAESGGKSLAYLAPRVGSEDVQNRLRAAGGETASHDDPGSLDRLRAWLGETHFVIDGLLGIGIRGAVREPMASIIAFVEEECRRLGRQVIAVDLPSGVDADTGEVAGAALHASETLSLGCVKVGLLSSPASEYVGVLRPVEIGLPEETVSGIARELLSGAEVAAILPRRRPDDHKGRNGRVLVVAGSQKYVGAPFLCGAAAARAGAGIVTLAVPAWQRGALVTLLPEATFLPLADIVDIPSARANAREIRAMLPACNVLAIGPGLDRGVAQTEMVLSILVALREDAQTSVVIDADALNALSGVEHWWERIKPGCVLTPHAGEMARLTGLEATEVNRARLAVAQDAAAKWGQVVVLKGAYTVIASPEGRVWVNGAALPALASGGTGDVLTGLIAGLMAQGSDAAGAARAGVYLHAEAARRVLSRDGQAIRRDRLLASELLPEIPWAIAFPAGHG